MGGLAKKSKQVPVKAVQEAEDVPVCFCGAALVRRCNCPGQPHAVCEAGHIVFAETGLEAEAHRRVKF